jgi:3-hydroxyisobutyrate dehydrogenase-like beta-hydroxyacid dehydrogenase
MINQILVGVNILGIAEAFVLGTKLGADPDVLFDVIRASAGSSFLLEKRVPNYILKGDFTQTGFALDLLRKDVGLAVESAKLNRMPLFVAAQVFQSLSLASATGLGKKDMSSVIEMYEKAVGIQVRGTQKKK